MKKMLLTVATLLLLTVSTVAQVPSPIKFYVGGGFSMPDKPGTFDAGYKNGQNVFAAVGLKLLPVIEAVGKAEHHQFSSDIEGAGDGKIKILMFGVDAKLTIGIPTFPLSPYGLAGIGFANVKQENFGLPAGVPQHIVTLTDALLLKDQTKFYYNLGAGVEWKFLPAVSLFAQGRVVNIFTSQDNSLPDVLTPSVFDEDTRFWAISAGVKLL